MECRQNHHDTIKPAASIIGLTLVQVEQKYHDGQTRAVQTSLSPRFPLQDCDLKAHLACGIRQAAT